MDFPSFQPYEDLVSDWKKVGPHIQWFISLVDSSNPSEINNISVLPEGVILFDEGASISIDRSRNKEILIHIPFDIGCGVLYNNVQRPVRRMERIYGPQNGEWTDTSGRIKLVVLPYTDTDSSQSSNIPLSSSPSHFSPTHKVRLVKITFQIHAERVLQSLGIHNRPEPNLFPNIPKDKGFGLRDFAIFITLRSSESDQKFFQYKQMNQQIAFIQSPYENTIAFQLPATKKALFPLQNKNLLVKKIWKNDKSCDYTNSNSFLSDFVVDVVLYDSLARPMWKRSGYLWLSKNELFSTVFCEGSTVSEDGFGLNFSFERLLLPGSNDGDNKAKLHADSADEHVLMRVLAVYFVVPLGRINLWFKTRYKLHDVAMIIMEW